jgi:hypothetical protein
MFPIHFIQKDPYRTLDNLIYGHIQSISTPSNLLRTPNIPIDNYPINPEKNSYDLNFYFILHAMKYVEDIQEIGN